ncbi:MAG: fumarylacetoacetate hydrolase family protein [Gammaproteobacteria bacterium]|nr:fumarylacetoacetate hydrolase family protein [Gammaproteobacteria bacterium]
MDVPPFRLSGQVYGVLLNHRGALAALGAAVSQPPYLAPPRAPVLYIKPRNTLNGPGGNVVVPADAPELEIGATLGAVIGRTACRVAAETALDHVAGYTIVGDVSVPHASFFRPAVRQQARDGFCCIGPRVVARTQLADPQAIELRVFVDGRPAQVGNLRDLVRPVATLIADVTEFMTLQAGDLLLLGVPPGAPRVRAGQAVAIEAGGIGRLESRFVAATAAASGDAP